VNARLRLDGRPWLRVLPLMLAAAALVLVAAVADAAPAKPPAIGVATTAHSVGKMNAAACNPKASSIRPSGPPQVTSGSFMANIRARGFLVAGVDQSTYHFGFLNPLDGRIEGFDIDMIRAVAQAIFGNPDKIRFVAISDAQRIHAVQSGEVDIVAHTMTITCARLQQVDFSTVYFDAGQRILVQSDSKARSLLDFEGPGLPPASRKICATTGSTSLANIRAESTAGIVGPIPVAVPYWTDCLVLLQQGDVAAISTDDSILAGLAAQDPFTKIVGPRFTDEPYGLAVSKQHPDFVAFVNAVLEQLRTSGQWSASYAHWIGTPVPGPPAALYRS
jgi:polar amino acid transport system substrate-binding protein